MGEVLSAIVTVLLIAWSGLVSLVGGFAVGGTDAGTDAPAPTATTATATVAVVVDGDTIELASGERVRLLGIDTPEYGECYFTESTAYLRQWLTGETVRLERDVTDRDDYHRLLRHVFAPAPAATSSALVHVNERLLEAGYAVVLPIPPDRAYRAEFAAAEAAAATNGRGLHRACE